MRFNTETQGTKTENLAGGEAFSLTPELELTALVLTSFAEDKYYRTAEEAFTRLRELLETVGYEFGSQLALYARREFGMRSITHVLAAEIAHLCKGEKWTRAFFRDVIYRPDDITEILAYYLANYGKPIPNALKDGLANALSIIDEYQLAKYRAAKAKVSLVDAVNLVHPKHTEPLKKLVDGTLKSFDTWEAGLSETGQQAETEEEKAELKAGVWRRLISEDKLGYFALLRNLRNIEAQAPDMLMEALKRLTDRERIRKSLVLPFRFQTAMKQLDNRKVIQALNQALEASVENIPEFSGRTLICVDDSGSMCSRPGEIASLFGAAFYKINDADVIAFASEARYVHLNPQDSVTTSAQTILNANWGGTDFKPIFITANQPYERIIIFSDMQGWVDYYAPTKEFAAYKQRHNCNPTVYSFDLAGYGTLQFPERNVYCLAGFSEKVFDIMKLLESDKDALVQAISHYEPKRRA